MSITELREYKKRLAEYTEHANDELNKFESYFCTVCDTGELAKEAIPKDWGWLGDNETLLCDVCIEKWTKQFGECKTTKEREL